MPNHFPLYSRRRALALIAVFYLSVPLALSAGGSKGNTPLIDYTSGEMYLNTFPGLLYTGSNQAPPAHTAGGLLAAGRIQPLDHNGFPSPTGAIVLMSVGMSNTTSEWCSPDPDNTGCDIWSFTGQAAAASRVNHSTLAILDGAANSQDAETWACATGNCNSAPNEYDRVRDTVLAPAGFTESQVQAVWIKEADMGPRVSLPNAQADAYILESFLGQIVRAIQQRWPKVKQVFLSSRIFAGYAIERINPEPFAYESGFSVKWLVEAQIVQRQTGFIDPVAGDLLSASSFIDWGPYLWGDGNANPPGSKALVWLRDDFGTDGTHPSRLGVTQVGGALLNFFKTSPLTPWFRAQ